MKVIKLEGTPEEVLEGYLVFWSGPFSMSTKEKEIVKWLIIKQYELEAEGVPKSMLDKLLLTPEHRKKMCEDIMISMPSLNNYISWLRKKNVLVNEIINPMLIPNDDIQIKIYVDTGNNQ